MNPLDDKEAIEEYLAYTKPSLGFVNYCRHLILDCNHSQHQYDYLQWYKLRQLYGEKVAGTLRDL